MASTLSIQSNAVSVVATKLQTSFAMLRTTVTHSSRRGARRLAQFKSEKTGSVLPIFTCALLPLFMAVGGSIDYGRSLMVRSQMQAALDSAVLAGGRHYQLTGDETAAAAVVNSYFGYRFTAKPLGNPHMASLTFDTAAYKITAKAHASVPTPFLSMGGIKTLQLGVASQSGLTIGGTAQGQSLEVSLMIDVTGSMNDSSGSGSSKLADAKGAAKDLLDALLPDGYAGNQSTRVALVPFSQYVNVGSTYYTAVTGAAPAGSGATCVTERTGVDNYNDDAPAAGSWIGKYTTNSNKGTLSCAPTAKLKPLTTDKAGLKSAIDSLVASGWTAGHLGTAWAWYTLSEKWAGIWPAASRPGVPSETLKKVAVLMTDGDYNTYYRNNTASRLQALELCQGMKSAGITVYTIAFGADISTATKADLQACASSQQHFHDAENGDALREAFQTIAISLSQLRLTQ